MYDPSPRVARVSVHRSEFQVPLHSNVVMVKAEFLDVALICSSSPGEIIVISPPEYR